MATVKTRNNNTWTEARFMSFIKSALRSASQRWPPKYNVLNKSCVGQKINPKSGRLAKFYKCANCSNDFPAKEIEINHKIPVILTTGFDSWDLVIERLFCEEDGLEALCRPCHKIITTNENSERRTNAK